MLLGPLFERFVQRSPFAVMSRALLEHALCPRALDALFVTNRTGVPCSRAARTVSGAPGMTRVPW